MRILVIGGTRFIGPNVVRPLLQTGHEVTLFHRHASNSGIPEVLGDRRNLAEYTSELRDLKPDVVIDMVAVVEGDGIGVVNVFSGYTKRVVLISSIDVYRAYGCLLFKEDGALEPTPITEQSPLRTRLYPYRGGDHGRPILNDYDKIPIERAIGECKGFESVVLRLPMVYGPGDYQHRLFANAKRIADGRPIILGEAWAKWKGARGFVEDVGRAIAKAAVHPNAAGEIFNVAEPISHSEAQWVELMGGQSVIVKDSDLPESLKQNGNPEQNLDASSDKIRETLGYEETASISDAIAATVAWELAENQGALDYSQEDILLDSIR